MCIKPSSSGAPDKLIWLGTKTGDYTAKSGYYTAVELEPNEDGARQDAEINLNKIVWKLECAPKIKTFA